MIDIVLTKENQYDSNTSIDRYWWSYVMHFNHEITIFRILKQNHFVLFWESLCLPIWPNTAMDPMEKSGRAFLFGSRLREQSITNQNAPVCNNATCGSRVDTSPLVARLSS